MTATYPHRVPGAGGEEPSSPERSEPSGPSAGAGVHDALGRRVGDDALAEATAALRSGAAVIIPTDTVYGVAALPFVPGATERLFTLKDRSSRQPLAVLLAAPADVTAVADELSMVAQRLIDAFWPGPLTLVLPRRPDLGDRLALGGDGSTVGVRCPAHPLVRRLAGRVGPIATTSANRHGEPTPVTATEAAEALTGPVAVVLDGGVLSGRASTVVDCTGPGWRLLRSGALDPVEVAAAAGEAARPPLGQPPER